MIFARADFVKVRPGFIMPACDVGEQRQTKVEIRRFVLTCVLNQPFFSVDLLRFYLGKEAGGGIETPDSGFSERHLNPWLPPPFFLLKGRFSYEKNRFPASNIFKHKKRK